MTAPSATSLVSRIAAPAAVAGVTAAGCAGVWLGDPTTPGGVLPVCPFKALTGLDCPGCGVEIAFERYVEAGLFGASAVIGKIETLFHQSVDICGAAFAGAFT